MADRISVTQIEVVIPWKYVKIRTSKPILKFQIRQKQRDNAIKAAKEKKKAANTGHKSSDGQAIKLIWNNSWKKKFMQKCIIWWSF